MTNHPDTQTFGSKLRALRKRNFLTQAEMASELGVGQTTIAAWEQRVSLPRGGILDLLSDYFDVPNTAFMSEHVPQDLTNAVLAVCKQWLQSLPLDEALEMLLSAHQLPDSAIETIMQIIRALIKTDGESDA